MKTSQESSVIYKRNPFAEHWHPSQLVMIYQRQVSTLSLTTQAPLLGVMLPNLSKIQSFNSTHRFFISLHHSTTPPLPPPPSPPSVPFHRFPFPPPPLFIHFQNTQNSISSLSPLFIAFCHTQQTFFIFFRINTNHKHKRHSPNLGVLSLQRTRPFITDLFPLVVNHAWKVIWVVSPQKKPLQKTLK